MSTCDHSNMIEAGQRGNANEWCPDCGWFPEFDVSSVADAVRSLQSLAGMPSYSPAAHISADALLLAFLDGHGAKPVADAYRTLQERGNWWYE